MKVVDTPLNGVKIIEPVVFEDHRGYFMESYNKLELLENGLNYDFIQDNHSFSKDIGVLRGLHYQLSPKAQTKLIRVTHGAIYDVVVDIRKESKTFGEWFGITLSAENKRLLLVPKGFAHGFCTLEKDTHVLYKVDEYYAPDQDRGIIWNDPILNIDWPIQNVILSDKDSTHPLFSEAEMNF